MTIDLNMLKWFADISHYTALVPAVACLIVWRRIINSLRIIGVLLIITFILGQVAIYLAENEVPNLAIAHLHTPIEFTFIFLSFHLMRRNLMPKKWVFHIIFTFILLSIVEFLFISGSSRINNFSRFIESLILVGVAIRYLRGFAKDRNLVKAEHSPFYWVSSGVLIYFGGTALVYLFSNILLVDSPNYLALCLVVQFSLNIIFNVIITTAIWTSMKSPRLHTYSLDLE